MAEVTQDHKNAQIAAKKEDCLERLLDDDMSEDNALQKIRDFKDAKTRINAATELNELFWENIDD